MAQYTIDVVANRSAYVDSDNPEVNYSSGASLIAYGKTPNTEKRACIGFPEPTTGLGRRVLSGSTIRLNVTSVSINDPYQGHFGIAYLHKNGAWTENGVTYNTRPISSGDYITRKWYDEVTGPGEWAFTIVPIFAQMALVDSANGIEVFVAEWNGNAQIVFNSTRAASGKPLIRLLMENAVPKVTPITPSGAYVYPYASYQIIWNTTDADNVLVLGGIRTAGSKFRYREVGAGSYTEITLANNARAYTLPANTLQAQKNYEWQVIETTTDGISSSGSTWYVITTHDSAPNKPTNLAPAGDYIAVDESNVFSWQHNIDTGTAQTKADLQYSLDNGAWQTLGTVTGVAQSISIPADTLPSGRLRWRVRTHNVDDVAGEWSDPAAIVGTGAPPTPIITGITQTSRPAVSWQSLGQVGYQAQLGDYDTGEVGGQAKTHKVPYYLPNGPYMVRVRIKGASMLWSAWAEQEITINVSGPEKPLLEATAVPGAALLTFAAPGASKLYILRDDVPIANVTGHTTYTDYAALGSAVYVLRAVDSSDNYTDSDPVGVTVSVPHGQTAILAAVDDMSNPISLKLTRGGPRVINGSKSRGVSYHNYAGREYPVARFSGYGTAVYEMSVAFLRSFDRDRLLAMLDRRRTLLYRDSYGNRWYVTIPSNGYEQDRIATSLSLAMNITDYVEQIEYEV